MAVLTTSKHQVTLVNKHVSKEEYDAKMDRIQKRINRIEKIQKTKNWKNHLTK